MVQMCKDKEGATYEELGEYVANKKPLSRMSSCLGACFLESLGIVSECNSLDKFKKKNYIFPNRR